MSAIGSKSFIAIPPIEDRIMTCRREAQQDQLAAKSAGGGYAVL
jgi:hypothetical protein